MKAIAMLFVAGVLLFNPYGQSSNTYRVDVNHSNIGFAVPISGGLSKVRGKFSKFETELEYDRNDITKSRVSAKIDVSSINTGIDARDEHLRTADFFDASKFPSIEFVSKKVVKSGKGQFIIGDLTVKGKTKEIRVPFEVTGTWVDKEKKTTGSGFLARLTIDRTDFGIDWQHSAVPDFVGNEVEVELYILTRSKKLE